MGNVMNVGSPLSGKRVALSEVKDDLEFSNGTNNCYRCGYL